jgi:aspartyl/asparaginyl beta-hydroxylase (cupin superfamily)
VSTVQLPSSELDRLVQSGAEALQRQDPAAARPLFERVTAARPADVRALVGLAFACRDLGDDAGQVAALDRVLAADPRHLPALLMKADHYAKIGDKRTAQTFYRAAVERAPPLETLPPQLRDEVRRAEQQNMLYAQSYQTHLRETLAAAGFDPATSSRRFTQSLDLLMGRKQIYFQSPTSFYFPELPQRQFYEREEFGWVQALEAQTDAIRDELLGVVGDDRAFQPYLQSDGNRPPRDFGSLLNNPDWSAFYLIRSGGTVETAAARCPRTMQILHSLPLCTAPGRTPSVLFSLLRPKTRIPPHTGYTNARLICHLPLIVPGGCGLRVGNETRIWEPGKALIFDDSIEHEAWNDSGELRVVLLLDVWRPELSLEERKLVAATLAAVGSYDATSPL